MIAIYARQSVEKKDSISIDGQIEYCRAECRDAPDKEVLIFKDAGYSGKNTDRPDFQRLMREVKNGNVKKIIVYRLDRISRSITDFGAIWETLNEHGAEFVSVREKFDTSTPVGRAMVYIIMVFAQLERETIAERIRDNFRQRIMIGSHPGGEAGYGLKIDHIQAPNGKKIPILVPGENAQIVKQIFDDYAYQNMSLGEIAKKLTIQGITPPRHGKGWQNLAISRILHNPIYVKADADIYYFLEAEGAIICSAIKEFDGKSGIQIVGRREKNVAKFTSLKGQSAIMSYTPGMIDSKTFLICQERMKENKQIKNSGSGKYSWLTGVLKCAECGYSMRAVRSIYTNPSGEKIYYKMFYCSGRSHYHICKSSSKNRKINEVEATVEREVCKKIEEIKKCPPTHYENAEGINEIKLELLELDKKIENLLNALEKSSETTVKYIDEKIKLLDKQKSELIKKIEVERKKRVLEIPEKLNFSELSFENKKRAIKLLVNRILLSDDGNVEIEWKL